MEFHLEPLTFSEPTLKRVRRALGNARVTGPLSPADASLGDMFLRRDKARAGHWKIGIPVYDEHGCCATPMFQFPSADYSGSQVRMIRTILVASVLLGRIPTLAKLYDLATACRAHILSRPAASK